VLFQKNLLRRLERKSIERELRHSGEGWDGWVWGIVEEGRSEKGARLRDGTVKEGGHPNWAQKKE